MTASCKAGPKRVRKGRVGFGVLGRAALMTDPLSTCWKGRGCQQRCGTLFSMLWPCCQGARNPMQAIIMPLPPPRRAWQVYPDILSPLGGKFRHSFVFVRPYNSSVLPSLRASMFRFHLLCPLLLACITDCFTDCGTVSNCCPVPLSAPHIGRKPASWIPAAMIRCKLDAVHLALLLNMSNRVLFPTSGWPWI